MRNRWIILVSGALVLAACAGWLVASETPPAPRVHTDGVAMAQGVVGAFDALLREDLPQAQKAITRLQTSCRRLAPEADETFGPGFRNRDQALHKVLDGTLGFIVDGRAEDAYTEFVWVTRTCRECHALARKADLLPPEGPMWPGALAGSKRVETTHTLGQEP